MMSLKADPRDHYSKIYKCVRHDPPRRVWLSTFEIDRHEVTAREYHACVDSLACRDPIDGPYDNTPAWVTFDQAEQYCKWRGKALPTKAQWQKAFRGTDDRVFPWGNFPPTCAHATQVSAVHSLFLECEDGESPRVVGTRPLGRSPYGAHDMEDNETEWVRDAPRDVPILSLERSYETSGEIEKFFPRFLIERFPDFAIVSVDWSTIEVTRHDPDVTDPLDESGARDAAPETRRLARRPRGFVEGGREGFRCVRARAVERAPDVTLPPDTRLPPYREPGYTPPTTGAPFDP